MCLSTFDPDHRLVARGLEREWEERLSELEAAKNDLARRERVRPRVLSHEERDRLISLGSDPATVWHAQTTTPRDRKELLRALIEEVILTVERDKANAHLTLRWKGGAITELDVNLPRTRPAPVRTDEDTIELVRRLAVHYPDAVIAGILNARIARGLTAIVSMPTTSAICAVVGRLTASRRKRTPSSVSF
jgi:hypothetical protein